MIIAFDLDDTLYDESAFVRSGFAAVADHMAAHWGVDRSGALGVMEASLARRGRGHQFDDALRRFGLLRRGRVRELVSVYRHHAPKIRLDPAAAMLLERLEGPAKLRLVLLGPHADERIEAGADATGDFGGGFGQPRAAPHELQRRPIERDPAFGS